MTDSMPTAPGITDPIYHDLHRIIDRMQDQLGAATVKRHVIVRCEQAGVFAGLLHWRAGSEVVLLDARRLWYWSGAASLSELALRGTRDPAGCTFPPAVGEITLLGVCEIIPTTLASRISIANVPDWTEWTDKELADATRMEAAHPQPETAPEDGAGQAPGAGNVLGKGHGELGWVDGAGQGSGLAPGHGWEDKGAGGGYATGEGSSSATGSSQSH